MKIINETELMYNQKASTVIVPDKQFEALQTIEGNSLVFSIGTDGILYCTREVPGDTHGWIRVDLSTALSAAVYGGAAVVAKTFDIAQDLSTGVNSVDIALVVTVNGKDYLHLATGFTNTFDNWTSATPSFTQYLFDDYAQPSYAGLPINEVQIVDGNGNQFIIADVITDATTQTISRYYIDTSFTLYEDKATQKYCAWVPHNLSVDLQAGTITSFLGCGPNDGPNGAGNDIGGVYVLGTIANEAQLIYAPTFNYHAPEMTQQPTVINFPANIDASHMAIALSVPAATAPYSDLFFASNGSLYFLANADQVNTETTKPTPQLIYTHALFQGIQSLHVNNWNDNIVIWGQSLDPADMTTSRLFIMEGVAGQETNAAAWSYPMIILTKVVNSSAYINNNYSLDSAINVNSANAYGSCSVLFAQQAIKNDDGTVSSVLTQLFQDPVTTAWQSRSLLTAPTPENIITEIYDTTTYSTHIEITDDNNIPVAPQPSSDGTTTVPPSPVAVWASSPCSVYVSDANNTAAYHTLDTAKALLLTPDFSGNVTIMQPVDTIGGISYYVAVQDPTSKQIYTEVINPLSTTISTLNTKVPDGNDHLQGVKVYDENNNPSLLVSSDYNSQTATASNQINTICQQNTNFNKDGLVTGQSWPDANAVEAAFSAIQSGTLSAIKPAAPKPAIKPAPAAAGKPMPKIRVKHAVPLPEIKNRVKKFAKADHSFKDLRFNPKTDKIWGWTYGKNPAHYEGIEAIKQMGISLNADGSLSLTSPAQLGSGLHIETKIGHFVSWLKNEIHSLEQVVITFASGVADCVITIAGDFYHFLIKCANDIVNLVHTVLNAIETAFKDLVAWIGMIFNFQDMLTTHAVLKNIINISIDYAETSFDKLNDSISTLFSYLEGQVDHKTGLPVQGLPSSTQTYSAASATGTPPAGSKSPSAKYGSHHLKNNQSNSDNNYSSVYQPAEDLFDSLLQLIANEGTAFTDLGTQIAAIAKALPDTPFTQSITELLGAIIDLALNTAENFLEAVVDVLKALLSNIKDVLNATIHIPVLSYFYKKMTTTKDNPNGDDLTALDLFCLIGGIFSTIVYKAVKQEAPFPQGASTTTAILNATDLPSLQIAINSLPTLSSTEAGLLGHGGDQTGKTPLNIVGSLAAMEGAVGVDSALIAKSLLPYDPAEGWEPNPADVLKNKFFSVIQSVCYMGYVLPDMIEGIVQGGIADAYTIDTWFVGMNNLCTYIAVAKAVVDGGSPWFPSGKDADNWGQKVSPIFDCVLNVIWQIPTVFQLLHDVQEHGTFVKADINAIVSCIGGTFFDLSGLYSPAFAYCYYFAPQGADREAAIAVAAAVISVCNLFWGGSCLATTFDGLPVPK